MLGRELAAAVAGNGNVCSLADVGDGHLRVRDRGTGIVGYRASDRSVDRLCEGTRTDGQQDQPQHQGESAQTALSSDLHRLPPKSLQGKRR